jgi:hypothetical protein
VTRPRPSSVVFAILAAPLLTIAAAGCGAAGEPSSGGATPTATQAGEEHPLTLVGFTGTANDVMRNLSAQRDDDTRLTGARLDQLEPEAGERGAVRLTLLAPYSDDEVERARARWEAAMLVAAFWREMRRNGLDVVREGGVRFQDGTREVDVPGVSPYIFTPDAADYLYTDADGNPSRLIAGQEELERRIRAGAREIGLRVDQVSFTGFLGTAVEVHATAPDPVPFLATFRPAMLYGSPNDLEGVFLVISDLEGDLVLLRSFSTGLAMGVGGVGPKYAGE